VESAHSPLTTSHCSTDGYQFAALQEAKDDESHQ